MKDVEREEYGNQVNENQENRSFIEPHTTKSMKSKKALSTVKKVWNVAEVF